MKKRYVIGGIILLFFLFVIIGDSNKPKENVSSGQEVVSEQSSTHAESNPIDLYNTEVQLISYGMRLHLNTLATLSDNPLKALVDEEYRAEILEATAEIQELNERAQKMSAPVELQEIDAEFKVAMNLFSQAMIYMESGIKSANAEDINRSNSLMSQGGNKLKVVSQKMLELSR